MKNVRSMSMSMPRGIEIVAESTTVHYVEDEEQVDKKQWNAKATCRISPHIRR